MPQRPISQRTNALHSEYAQYAGTFDRLMRKLTLKSLNPQTKADIWTACGALLAAMAKNPAKDDFWTVRYDRHQSFAAIVGESEDTIPANTPTPKSARELQLF